LVNFKKYKEAKEKAENEIDQIQIQNIEKFMDVKEELVN